MKVEKSAKITKQQKGEHEITDATQIKNNYFRYYVFVSMVAVISISAGFGFNIRLLVDN